MIFEAEGMPKQILLFGFGGHAKVLVDALKDLGVEVVGFFDQKQPAGDSTYQGIAYLGAYDPDILPAVPILIAVGDNNARAHIAKTVKHTFSTLIHPTAIVSPSASIGRGSVVLQGAVIQADATIGSQVIVNAGVIVDHDAAIEDFSHLRPYAYIGGGATVKRGCIVQPLQLIERNTVFQGV